MSRTLHVAKTYKVEWDGLGAFNRQDYEFRILLNELGVAVASVFDEENYLDFEVRKEDWKHAIAMLERPTLQRGVKSALSVLGCTKDEALSVFKACLEKAESEDEWMHFSFF